MTPPTLLDAAKAVSNVYADRDFYAIGSAVAKIDPWLGRMLGSIYDLEAAIAAEEAKPKVERVEFWVDHSKNPSVYDLGRVRYEAKDGWSFYAERPIPVKSEAEELAEEIEKAIRWLEDPADFKERGVNLSMLHDAAKLLRERK